MMGYSFIAVLLTLVRSVEVTQYTHIVLFLLLVALSGRNVQLRQRESLFSKWFMWIGCLIAFCTLRKTQSLVFTVVQRLTWCAAWKQSLKSVSRVWADTCVQPSSTEEPGGACRTEEGLAWSCGNWLDADLGISKAKDKSLGEVTLFADSEGSRAVASVDS